MISEKQHEANRRNAQKSTGPKTPEGKAKVRFNALQHGLRATSTLLPGEVQEEFDKLCADLAADWQPQNRTEALLVEQMATDQWILARLSNAERAVFHVVMNKAHLDERLQSAVNLLDRFSQQKARLQRSFSKSIHDLEHLQNQRRKASAQTKPANPKPQPGGALGRPTPQPQPPQAADEPEAAIVVSADTR